MEITEPRELEGAELRRLALADGDAWPPAVVTDDPSYTRVTQILRDAQFIWTRNLTRNLKLDNLVLARYTAKGPRR